MAVFTAACPGPRTRSYATVQQVQQAIDDCKRQPCADAQLGGLENQLGYLYLSSKDAASAEPHLRSAVAHLQRAFGRRDPRTMISIDNLATVLTQLGKVEESIPLHQEACSFLESHAGVPRRDLGICLTGLGHAFAQHGDRQSAVDAYKRAWQIFSADPGHGQELDVVLSLMAHLQPRSDRLQVALPGKPWFLLVGEIPGLQVEQDYLIAPGDHRYVFATNHRLGVGVSVRLKKMAVGSARACREAYTGPGELGPDLQQRGARISDQGTYSEFEDQTDIRSKDESRSNEVIHLVNLYRYLVHDGVCMTIHLSREIKTPADRSLFEQILSTIAVLDFGQFI